MTNIVIEKLGGLFKPAQKQLPGEGQDQLPGVPSRQRIDTSSLFQDPRLAPRRRQG